MGGDPTMEFWHGILVTLIPSMFVVAWLVGRSSPVDEDHKLNKLGDSEY
jgi:hypothetical protein